MATADKALDLVLGLLEVLNVVAMVVVELAVLLAIATPRIGLHRLGLVEQTRVLNFMIYLINKGR